MATTRNRRPHSSPLPPAVEAEGEVREAVRVWWAARQDWQLKESVHDAAVKADARTRALALASVLDAGKWEAICWGRLYGAIPCQGRQSYTLGPVTVGYTAADRRGLSLRAVVDGVVVRK